eukprot:TRINITY_DN174_c0_g1_i3.p1 TRINITY_DN174_c0_g1~~TRINITY_DN174_c0_g1_i3.p1  ORF type:complete len:407 (-),score=102.31 TRINITY_DN174_c0_g1_i3:90-1310(-)
MLRASLVVVLALLGLANAATVIFNPIALPALIVTACTLNSNTLVLTCNWGDALFTAAGLGLPGVDDDVSLEGNLDLLGVNLINFNIGSAVSIKSLSIQNGGQVVVATGAALNVGGAVTVDDDSTLEVSGSAVIAGAVTLGSSATATVAAGASLTASFVATALDSFITVGSATVGAARASLIINANSQFGNNGLRLNANADVSVVNAAVVTLSNAFTAAGNVVIDTNAGIVVNSGGYTQNNGTQLTLNGYLTVASVTNIGTISGNGAINGSLTNSGTLSPGSSPGTTVIRGDYTQTSSGTYKFEIQDGSRFDRLVITGAISRNGILHASLLDKSYRPSNNQRFQIMTHRSASGTFNIVRGDFDDTFASYRAEYMDSDTALIYSTSSASARVMISTLLVVVVCVSFML